MEALTRRIIEVETAVYGRPDRQEQGLRGELNDVSMRLDAVEEKVSSIHSLLRIGIALIGATGGGVWWPLVRGWLLGG